MTVAPSRTPTPIEVVLRKLGCVERQNNLDMKRGLGVLATIASTAPLIGLLGTVFGIKRALGGYSGTSAGLLVFVFGRLSTALVTTALSLFVAISAAWSYNIFAHKVETICVETKNSILELANYLLIAAARNKHEPERHASSQ